MRPLSKDRKMWLCPTAVKHRSARKVAIKQLWNLKRRRTYDVGAPDPIWPQGMAGFRDEY